MTTDERVGLTSQKKARHPFLLGLAVVFLIGFLYALGHDNLCHVSRESRVVVALSAAAVGTAIFVLPSYRLSWKSLLTIPLVFYMYFCTEVIGTIFGGAWCK